MNNEGSKFCELGACIEMERITEIWVGWRKGIWL